MAGPLYPILKVLESLGRIGSRVVTGRNLTYAQKTARDAGGQPKSDLLKVQENIRKIVENAQKVGDVVNPSRVKDISRARLEKAKGPGGSPRNLDPRTNRAAAAYQGAGKATKGFSLFSEGYNKTILAGQVEKHLKSTKPSSVPEINRIIKKAVNPIIASAIIEKAAPAIKKSVALSNNDTKSTGRKSGAKDSAERAATEKKETFGERFAKERKAAKKRGDELSATFTYKGKSYHTRIKKEEDARKEKAAARTSGGGKDKTGKPKKANRGALVSRQRKGHTDMRKGGLFR